MNEYTDISPPKPDLHDALTRLYEGTKAEIAKALHKAHCEHMEVVGLRHLLDKAEASIADYRTEGQRLATENEALKADLAKSKKEAQTSRADRGNAMRWAAENTRSAESAQFWKARYEEVNAERNRLVDRLYAKEKATP